MGSAPATGAPAASDPATGAPTASDAGGSDPGCAPAENAITAVTDDFGHDLGNPSASVADAQKAVDLADTAVRVAVNPAVKSAADTLRTHLEALHTAAQTSDFGSEAATLQSIEGDIDAVFSACGA